jgi:ankyrin repeat protein
MALATVIAMGLFGGVSADAQIICCKKPTPSKAQQPGSATLFDAAMTGTADAVKELLDGGANPNVKDPYGWTPLMAAIQKGNVAAVRLMVERGADVNAAEKHGLTPLKLAIEKKDPRIIQLVQNKRSTP